MRHWFLAVLIALLPLRGWVGDAMAMQMAHQAMSSGAAAGDHGHHVATGADVAMSDDVAHPMPADHAVEADGADHGQHIACDICNGPALASDVPRAGEPDRAHPISVVASETFISASLILGFKPPIS